MTDSGEDQPGRPKASPILTAEGPCCAIDDIAARFIEASREIEKKIAYFVEGKIRACLE